MENEMIEMTLLQQQWAVVSGNNQSVPVAYVETKTDSRGRPVQAQNIQGLLNNDVRADNYSMQGSAAWLKFPISFYDATVFNYTLFWQNLNCPNSATLNCLPQGGFAFVFQQETSKSMGNYQNNYGEGLGYDGISGLLAIEFDMMVNPSKNDPASLQGHISVQKRNPYTGLLSSNHLHSIAFQGNPANFVNSKLQGFQPTVNVSIGLFPNQQTKELIIVVELNGIRQIYVETTFGAIGLDPTRAYFVGFTAAQNLDKNVPTGYLNINNFRMFKSRPRFVEGQVQFLNDTLNRQNMEVRTHFMNLCKQKTTLLTYPSSSLTEWQTNLEDQDIVGIAFYNQVDGQIVFACNLQQLQKTNFYSPAKLFVTTELSFNMYCPTTLQEVIRLAFYYKQETVANLTALDYKRLINSGNFATLVIENSDLITGYLSIKGNVNNQYQFNVYAFDSQLNPISVTVNMMNLTVTSQFLKIDNQDYSNTVTLVCDVLTSLGTTTSGTNSTQFACSFIPIINGTYFINSPYLPGGKSFKIDILPANQVKRFLSSDNSYASVLGDFEIEAGSEAQFYIDLRDNENNSYPINQPFNPDSETCTFSNSYYNIDNLKYSFLFTDSYPTLRTIIQKAGVANFHIIVTCKTVTFELYCYRCQKLIRPLSIYYYSILTQPAYPSTYTVTIDSQVVLTQSQNLVLDLEFFDRFDNLLQVDKNPNDFQTMFVYGTNLIKFQTVQMPGKLHFYLSDIDNAFVKALKPRANYYYVAMNNPTSDQCNSTKWNYIPLLISSQDRMAPIEVVQGNDDPTFDKNTSVVYWDKLVQAGNVGRFAFILRNKNGLQINQWIPLDNIAVSFYDTSNQKIGSGCTSRLSLGLYEGEYYGWFTCNTPMLLSMTIVVTNGTTSQLLSQLGVPITIVSNTAYMADTQFSSYMNQQLTVGDSGVDMNFKLLDRTGQPIDSILVNRGNPQLGTINYNLTKVDSGNQIRYGTIPMKSGGNCRVQFINLTNGVHRLTLNLPFNKTFVEFNVTQSSSEISPLYSSASRKTGTTTLVRIGDYITVNVIPKTIHNRTVSNSTLLVQQIKVQVTSQEGTVFLMNVTGVNTTLPDGSLSYEYKTITPVTRKGTYFTDIQFLSTGRQLYVVNGTFNVDESFWVADSELYLLKGIDQKEYKMFQWTDTAAMDNTLKMQHYDSKIDGNLRFKMYFRTRNFYEIISNVDLSNHQFSAYMSYTTLRNNNYEEFSAVPNITFTVIPVNSDYLLIVPANYSDLTNIEDMQEGIYMIVIQDITAGTTYTLRWLFSVFNQLNMLTDGNLHFYTPSYVNITAGEPFTFVCEISSGTSNNAQLNQITAVFNELSAIDIQNTIVGNIFYVSVYHEKVGTFKLLLQAQNPQIANKQIREITIQVNPNEMYSLSVLGSSQFINRTQPVGTFVQIQFDLRDRYGNNILTYQKHPYLKKVAKAIQISHQYLQPIIVQQQIEFNATTFKLTFTTNYIGNVTITSPLILSSNRTFSVAFYTTLPPSYKTSYMMVSSTRVKTGDTINASLILKDQFGNKVNYTVTSSMFIVNLIPDNQCNATTQTLTFQSQVADTVTFTGVVTRSCAYNMLVNYFSPDEGLQVIPCVNCYVYVEPSGEDVKRLELIDGRDMPVTLRNEQSLHFRKYDQNPFVIMTFRDQYDNLIPVRSANLTYTYQFDLVNLTSETVIKQAQWYSYISFHYLLLCSGGAPNGCFEQITSARLRVIQRNKTTGLDVAKFFYPISIIENYGLQYQADSVNPISATYSYLRILNQDVIEGLGYDLPVLQDKCIGGRTYPIIGRLDVRNVYGFRRFENFDSLINRISIVVDELDRTQYDVRFYAGTNNGTVVFTMFIQDDFFFDTKLITANLYLDGTLFTNRKINIQCRRRPFYSKYVISSSTYQAITSLEQTQVRTGDPLTIYMINQDSNGARFLPYDNQIALYNSASGIINATYTVTEDIDKNIQIFNFPGLLKPGNYSLVGHSLGWSNYKVEVKASNISSQYSYVTVDSYNITTQDYAVINISPFDNYGNSISIQNNELTLEAISNQKIMVYYSKFHPLRLDRWRPVTSSILQPSRNTLQYSIEITEKGIYYFRVTIQGKVVSCQQCLVRVQQSQTLSIPNSIVTDMSQNYYQSAFGTGRFRMITKSSYLYMKLILKDANGNAYLSEEPLGNQTIIGKISNVGIDLNVTRLMPTATGCQVYKIIIRNSSLPTFLALPINTYNLDLTLNNQTLTTPIYVKSQTQTYPALSPTVTYNIRKLRQEFTMIAGKYKPLAFDMVDDQGIMISNYQTMSFNFNIDKSNVKYAYGPYIMGQYRGMYERLVKIDTSVDNSTGLFQRDDIQISVSNTAFKANGEYIYTVVYPGMLAQISYDNLNYQLTPMDSQGNPIEVDYDDSFQVYIVQQRPSMPTQRLANYQLTQNYLTKKIDVSLEYSSYSQLSQFSIQDSLFNYQYNAYARYQASPTIYIDKSYFTLNQSYLLSNETVQIRVTLVDYMGNSANSQLTQADLRALKVMVVLPNQQDVIVLNFSSNALVMNYTVTKTGFSFIQVTYNGMKIKVRDSSSTKWFYADPNLYLKTPNNSTFTFSMAAIQRFKIDYPQTVNGNEYLNFMKTQPFFLFVKICDALGNPINDNSIYATYNVGDLGLQTKLEGLGISEQISTSIIYNVIRIMIDNSTQREFYTRLVPTASNSTNLKSQSYVVKLNTPGQSKTFDVSDIVLQLGSNSAVENYLAANNFSSNNKTMNPILQSNAFEQPGQAIIYARQYKRQVYIIQVQNLDNKTFSSEIIRSVQVSQLASDPKTKITVFPFMNDGFYRVQFYSESLYDTKSNQLRVQIRTSQTYQTIPFQIPMQLYVHPPTPPNNLNLLTNLTWLQYGKSAYSVYQKIQVNLTLAHDGVTYQNDLRSTNKILVYKKNANLKTAVNLLNNNIYSFTLTLDEPNQYQMSIFYNDSNALYPIIAPEVIIFNIKPLDQLQMDYVNWQLQQSDQFKWWKLPREQLPPQYLLQLPSQLQAVSIEDAKIQFIPNLNNNEYVIGNDFRAYVMLVSISTGKCFLATDYNYLTELDIQIKKYDRVNKQPSNSTLAANRILTVKQNVTVSQSNCAYYVQVSLQTNTQISDEGAYILLASFQNKLTANFTFNAKVAGIDFTQTQVGWYPSQSSSDPQSRFIAEFKAYEEFSYLIYFRDVKGNSVPERVAYVRIQIYFEGQNLIEGSDFTYLSRYDDRYQGYLITIQFMKAGSFQPQYYFNLQKANVVIKDGPALFFVREPQCKSIQILSSGERNLKFYQQLVFAFMCRDQNGHLINSNIQSHEGKAVFVNTNMSNYETYTDVVSNSDGKYSVNHKFSMEGTYYLKIYFNQILVYMDPRQVYTVSSDICRNSAGQILYRCPLNPNVCANNYYECDAASANCTDLKLPFQCSSDSTAPNQCVSNMQSCCLVQGKTQPDFQWCPHLNKCVNLTTTPCCSLNTSTQIFCKSQNKCVSKRSECCDNYSYSVTDALGKNTLVSMVKCTYEDKCVPENSRQYCFTPFGRSCSEVFGDTYPYQCMNDGKCKRNQTECPSPKACPPGYTQCPDYSCIPGLNSFNECPALQQCTRKLPNQQTVEYIRCSDGSCARTYEDCPSQISCLIDGHVVCPDGSCRSSEYLCPQPIYCSGQTPLRCPGTSNQCVASLDQCSVPMTKVCPATQILCPNGDCSDTCNGLIRYNQSNTQGIVIKTLRYNCSALGMIQCPNYECRSSYDQCSTPLYCPMLPLYTFSPQPFICPSAQICALEQRECRQSHCQRPLNSIVSSNAIGTASVSTTPLLPCPDGRCHISTLSKQNACMTPISCSPGYFKSGGFGEFCLQSTTLANHAASLALILNANTCSDNQFKCLTGECRNSADECPTQITCPSSLPILCRDGQCVKNKQLCSHVDEAVQTNLKKCLEKSQVLCTSDLITCTDSLGKCPTRNSCPIGQIRCWNEQCIDPSKQNCTSFQLDTNINYVSTCSESSDKLFHCVADGSCRASLEDCPTLSICPPDRPVKCLDNSCRLSIMNCPQSYSCPAGFKFCPGDGNCVQQGLQCGSASTCPPNKPFKCENQQCVADYATCSSSLSHQLSSYSQQCIEKSSNYLCSNMQLLCTNNLTYCPSSKICLGSNQVRSFDTDECLSSSHLLPLQSMYVSLTTQDEFAIMKALQQLNINLTSLNAASQHSSLQCPLSLPFKCSNGLCVRHQNFCPQCPFAPIDLEFCQNQADSTGIQANIPCGNGICVKSSGQCPPLYDCLLNTLTKDFFRCNDGSCKQDPSQCNNTDPNTCPSHAPFLCQNGMCAASFNDCVISENGCTERLPYRCPFTGQCQRNSSQCLDTFSTSKRLFLIPSNTTAASKIDLNQAYGKISNICETQGKYLCRFNNGQTYCADTLSQCNYTDTVCPVDAPIRCGGTCVSKASSCSNDTCTYSGGRCPNGQCMSTYFNNCTTITGCPPTSPFLCSTQGQPTCKPLPYSSNPLLFNYTCSAVSNNRALNQILNGCESSDLPYSCADGTCVKNVGECKTCSYYCDTVKKCVASRQECQEVTLRTPDQLQNLSQLCPISSPTRCIVSGKCVTNEKECMVENQRPLRSQFNYTFTGQLLSDKCPYMRPIQCQDGRCVERYDNCFKYLKEKPTPQFIKPIDWGTEPVPVDDQLSPCQVYCQDGSCRDKVENCPLIQGCYDPQRPYRCKSGFCAVDQNQCLLLFGTFENENSTTPVSSSCSSVIGQKVMDFHRCEDGVCRPVSVDPETNATSYKCLPYMGCPLERPYHCPTGDCVVDAIQCAGTSQCSYDKPFRCKNFECVSSVSDCKRPYHTYAALQIDRTINPYSDNSINFAYTGEGQAIGKMKLQYSTQSPNPAETDIAMLTTSLDLLQRVQVYPVPDSILEKVQNQIPMPRIDYISRIYPLSGNTSLSRSNSLLTPVVQVASQNEDLKYFSKGSIQFKLDNSSVPSVINLQNDICLGKIINLGEENPSWQCVSRKYTVDEEGFYTFNLYELGAYGIIINPDPDYGDQETCGFICQNHTILLILELILLTFLAFLIYCLFICCQSKRQLLKKQQQQSKVADSQKDPKYFGGPNNSQGYFPPQKMTPPHYLPINATTMGDETYSSKKYLHDFNEPESPIAPSQAMVALQQQNQKMEKQILLLKSQLEEYQDKEGKYMSLLKATHENYKVMQEQIHLKQELSVTHQSVKSSKTRSRRPKKKHLFDESEFEFEGSKQFGSNVEPFQSQSMETYEMFPHQHSISSVNRMDSSLMTLQDKSNLLINDQSKDKHYSSEEYSLDKGYKQKVQQKHALLIQEESDESEEEIQKEQDDAPEVSEEHKSSRFSQQSKVRINPFSVEEEMDYNKSIQQQENDSPSVERPVSVMSLPLNTEQSQEEAESQRILNVRRNFFAQSPQKNQGELPLVKDTRAYNMPVVHQGITGSVTGKIIKLPKQESSPSYKELSGEKQKESNQASKQSSVSGSVKSGSEQRRSKRSHHNSSKMKTKNYK